MPGRRNRGNRKRSAPARAPRASPRRLLEQARELLAGGDGRKALDLIRQARDRDDSLAGLPLVSFCASMERARQLAAKGMDKEATTMRVRADRYRASISVPSLSEDEWLQYVRYLDGGDALATYADHLAGGTSMLRVERALADRLVVQRCWAGLDVFDESHPLRRDAVAVMPGLDAMDAVDWAGAASLLQGVPRRSPFAAWRLFCKASVCFGAGDDDGLRRTLDLLPADFVLARTVAEWRRLVGCDAAGSGRAGAPMEPGSRNGHVAALAGELKRALDKGNVRAAGKAIERLADSLYPEDPDRARIDLLEIAGLATLRNLIPGGALEGLARRLLPADRVTGVAARILLARQQAVPESWHPVPAVALVDVLPVEFPRAEDRTLARACVLEALARTGRAAVDPESLSPDMTADLTMLLGRPVEDPATVFVDLMLASLEADPDNRDGYLFLLDLLRGQNAAKPRLQRALQDMADRFPDDSTPWLELATLHYSRNAYRQAEGALEEARRRAPHDDRLLDLQAVGFLKSADQSRNKGRLALATRDLQRAADIGRRVIEPVLPAKRLLLEIVSGGSAAAATVDPHLEGQPPGAQLRTLALVLRDLDDNSHVRNVRPEMANGVRRLLAGKVSLAGEWAPDEIAGLLEPLPAELDVLYGDRRIAASFAAWWPALLERVDGERLPAVLDLLMDCGGRPQVRAEIERRLRGVRKPRRDPLLLFYLAVIRYEEGSDHDSRRFRDVLRGADAATRERLRAAAARLARHTQDPLRHALQTFDFEPLDVEPGPLGPGPPPRLEAFLAALEEQLETAGLPRERAGSTRWAPDPGDPALVEQFRRALTEDAADAPQHRAQQGMLFDREIYDELDRLDDLIDDNRLRGEPPPVLRELAGNLRAEPATRRALDRLARDCQTAGLRDKLTPELHALLFPHKGGKRRR